MGKPDTPSERKRIAKALVAEGRCPLCPPHRGENSWHRHGGRRKRSDNHKNHRSES